MGAHRNFRALPCVAEMRLFWTHFKNYVSQHRHSIRFSGGSYNVIYRYKLTLCPCRFSAV